MPRQVTLKDIAREANLSIAAVSKALNDYEHVSAETKKKVLAISERMNYRPRRRHARADNGSRTARGTHTSGLLLLGLDPVHQYSRRWLMTLTRAAEERGVRLQLSSLGMEDLLADSNLSKLVDGLDSLILFGFVTPEIVQAIRKIGLPWVVLGMVLGQHGMPVRGGWVVLGDATAMAEAATHALIRAGHRRIAFICGAHDPDTWNDRWQSGYRVALRHAGIEVSNDLCRVFPKLAVDDEITRGAHAVVNEVMSQPEPPTAFVSPTVDGAARVLRRMTTLGYHMAPCHVVVGGDPYDLAQFGMEGFSYVGDDAEAMCRTAIALVDSTDTDGLPTDATIIVPFVSDLSHVQPPGVKA